MHPLAARVRGDDHLVRVAGGDVFPRRATGHALGRTEHLAVEEHYKVGLEMVAGGADLEGQVMGGMSVLRGDDVREINGGKMAPVTLHGVVHIKDRPAVDIKSHSDIVVLVLDAVCEHGTAAAFRDADIVVYVEECTVLGDTDFLGANPLGAAPAAAHQAGLEPGGVGVNCRARLVRDAHLPEVACRSPQCSPVIRDVERLGRTHQAAVEDQITAGEFLGAVGDRQPISSLCGPDAVRRHLPTEIWSGFVDSHRGLHGLGAQIDYDRSGRKRHSRQKQGERKQDGFCNGHLYAVTIFVKLRIFA